MSRAERHIPERLLEAGKAAGQRPPLWYAGPRNGDIDVPETLEEIVMSARKEAGIEGEVTLPPLGPQLPDPYDTLD